MPTLNLAASCVVWNAGQYSSDENGGGALDSFIATYGIAAIATATGAPWSDTDTWDGDGDACEVTEGSAGGEIRITGDAGDFSLCKVGMLANIVFNPGGTGRYTNGGYQVTAVDISGRWIEVSGHDGFEGNDDCDVKVGGYLKTLSYAGSIDEMAATGNNKTIYVRGDEPIEAAGTITQGGSGANRLFIIGVDSNYEELATGEYAQYENVKDPISLGGVAVLTVSGAQVILRHIWVDKNGTVSGDRGIYFTGARCVTVDCKVTGCLHGIHGPVHHTHINPTVFDNGSQGIGSTGGVTVHGGFISGSTENLKNNIAGMLIANNVTIVGGTFSISSLSPIGATIQNCSIYNAGTYAVQVNNAACIVTIVNCILHVSNPAADGSYGIYRVEGNYTEKNNITNAHANRSGFQSGSGSVDGLAFTATDPMTLPASGDYSLSKTGAIAIAYAINKGLFGLSLGAVQLRQAQGVCRVGMSGGIIN